MNLHQIGQIGGGRRQATSAVNFPAWHRVCHSVDDHRFLRRKDEAGPCDALNVLAGGARAAGPPQVMAAQARGRVVDRPQPVAAVAARVIGQPLPGEERPPQRAGILRRRIGGSGRRRDGARPCLREHRGSRVMIRRARHRPGSLRRPGRRREPVVLRRLRCPGFHGEARRSLRLGCRASGRGRDVAGSRGSSRRVTPGTSRSRHRVGSAGAGDGGRTAQPGDGGNDETDLPRGCQTDQARQRPPPGAGRSHALRPGPDRRHTVRSRTRHGRT